MSSDKPVLQPEAETALRPQAMLTPDKSLLMKIAPGSGAREVVDEGTRVLGAQLVTQLNILFKTVRVHERKNAALDQVLEILLITISTMAQDQPIVIRLQNGFLYLGTLHLKLSPQHTAIFFEFIDLLNAKKIGAISFAAKLQAAELREFAYLFVAFDPSLSSFGDLQQRLKKGGVDGITLEELTSVTVHVDVRTKEPKALAKQLYLKAVSVVGEIMQGIKQRAVPNFRQAKRVVQHIVDLIQQDEQIMLGLTTLRCYDQYTHNHSVNVSLLSIALANRVGYDKPALVDLGVAALFHDLGKTSISHDLLNKPRELSDEEWTIMRRHPVQGVINLTRLRGVKNVPPRMAAAAFEHHMNLDFSGYPKLTEPWELSLSGRILMIADTYDGMTSARVYRRTPMTPHKVLQVLWGSRGKKVDGTLLKLFINCVGMIPIGSLVLLDTEEVAVITRTSPTRTKSGRPWVKLITDPAGNPIHGPEIDLEEKDGVDHFCRSIVRLIDNTEHRFDTSRYFVE